MKPHLPVFPILLAGLLAGTSFWLEHYVRTQASHPDGRLRHDPDMIAQGASQERFDANGKRLYVLKTEKLSHYPDDQSTHVTKPQLMHFGKPQPLTVTSDTARILGEGREIVLTGNVLGRREAGADQPALGFATSSLTVLPDDERAFTEEAVHMTHGRSIIDGQRLEIDQLHGLVSLHQVRATVYSKSQDQAR
ncbi:LPS export ABC transporter periplasmic protein LptC [Niveibacterium terrae]|uniref:LPS export ABC transporter periplasmic protein LptC n=1 Tax=Niveibacterium terrae TaxID=3373598 RepID=UPI003A926725